MNLHRLFPRSISGVFLEPENLPHLGQCFDAVRAVPVDPAAATAGLEIALRIEDIGGDPFPNFGAIDDREKLVAPKTPGHDAAKRHDGEAFRHLPELIPEVVSPHEEMVSLRFPAPDQFRIAREDHPAGSERLSDEILIRYLREIFDVASQEA
jgi:hypothetical protein